LNDALKSFEECASHEITINCGDNGHPPADIHTYGWAADIGHNSNPWLDRSTAEDCFKKSFPQGVMESYAQQEYNSDDKDEGWHSHVQYFPGIADLSGFAPRIMENDPGRKWMTRLRIAVGLALLFTTDRPSCMQSAQDYV
jgi:hypothetical protein